MQTSFTSDAQTCFGLMPVTTLPPPTLCATPPLITFNQSPTCSRALVGGRSTHTNPISIYLETPSCWRLVLRYTRTFCAEMHSYVQYKIMTVLLPGHASRESGCNKVNRARNVDGVESNARTTIDNIESSAVLHWVNHNSIRAKGRWRCRQQQHQRQHQHHQHHHVKRVQACS